MAITFPAEELKTFKIENLFRLAENLGIKTNPSMTKMQLIKLLVKVMPDPTPEEIFTVSGDTPKFYPNGKKSVRIQRIEWMKENRK
jgi:hypothetical protein